MQYGIRRARGNQSETLMTYGTRRNIANQLLNHATARRGIKKCRKAASRLPRPQLTQVASRGSHPKIARVAGHEKLPSVPKIFHSATSGSHSGSNELSAARSAIGAATRPSFNASTT